MAAASIVRPGPQIADSRHPHGSRRCVESLRGVLQHADAVALERLPHAIAIEPAIVVAENGDCARRRAESLKLACDLFRRHELSAEHSLDDEISEDADQVGVCGVGEVNDPTKLVDPVER